MTPSRRPRQRGVSLLEAVVALAVMAIGAVGIVGLQVSLRHNADLAKQRSEATRLAQETLEQWRGFTSFGTIPETDWSDLTTRTDPPIQGSNATFTRSVTVVARGETDDEPRSKTVHVRVAWTDRTGDPQAVELNSIIAGIAPELTGSVLVPMRSTLLKRPGWRHPSIPLAAIDQGNGTSTFVPPGAPAGVQWIFSNETGLILKNGCLPTPTNSCVDKMPVYGFIRFATNPAGPTPADAESPTSPAIAGLQVQVAQTVPYGPQTVSCYQDVRTTDIAYFCAVPVNAPEVERAWSGQSRVDGLDLAASVADASASAYRVCRYTPARNCQPVVPNPEANDPGSWLYGAAGSTLSCTDPNPSASPPTPKRRMSNADHPLNYVDVKEPLVGQNFLVIRAGNGATAYACPADDSATPLIQGNTWHHQPAS